MEQTTNIKYAPLFQQKARYVILMGGRGAGRSTVGSQYAVSRLVSEEYFRCAIMRYVLGDIRNSIYREIIDRTEESDIFENLQVNDTNMVINYGVNMINAVGFKKSSGQQKAKLKSLANYNCVLIEEADEIPEADFIQLDDSLRTVKGDIVIILMLNCPPKTHWINKRWFDLHPSGVPEFYIPTLKTDITDTLFIRTSYKDNLANIAPDTAARYEGYKITKPKHYWNMIRGLVPETIIGRIYTNWKVIDKVPDNARYKATWLDFGYTNDPTSIGDVYEYDGGYILDEIAYSTGLFNEDIATILKSGTRKRIVVADCSEPKSIATLKREGITIIPSVKGSDSVKYGIDIVQAARISITQHSAKTIEENENYAWLIDKEGDGLNVPKPGYDHSMDGIRYVITFLEDKPKNEFKTVQTQGVAPMDSSLGIG